MSTTQNTKSRRKRKLDTYDNKENISSPSQTSVTTPTCKSTNPKGSNYTSPNTPQILQARCINQPITPLTCSVNTIGRSNSLLQSVPKRRGRPTLYDVDSSGIIGFKLPGLQQNSPIHSGDCSSHQECDNMEALPQTNMGRPAVYTTNRIEKELLTQTQPLNHLLPATLLAKDIPSTSRTRGKPKGNKQTITKSSKSNIGTSNNSGNTKGRPCTYDIPDDDIIRTKLMEDNIHVEPGIQADLQQFSGIHPDYKDIGDPIYIYNGCNARLWKSEAKRGNPTLRKKVYSLCCLNGKVELPKLKQPPQLLVDLMKGQTQKSKDFVKDVRRYNMMFSFTSMGGKLDYKVNSGRAPFVYRMHGQNYHLYGSLLPPEGQDPRFCQLYIYDTYNEVDNRINAYGNSTKSKKNSTRSDIDVPTVYQLKGLLDFTNPLVQQFRQARDRFDMNAAEPIKLKIIGSRDRDGRTHNLPSANEVAALIIGDIDGTADKRDIIVETKSKQLQRISELHPSYLALQYPLLFPYAEDGYRPDIYHKGVEIEDAAGHARLTIREFFAYRLQFRDCETSLLLLARTLLQQFIVDGYTMVENTRLNYIRKNQKVFRCAQIASLYDAQESGDYDVSVMGTRITLPSSFTGGPRYMRQNYLDAMAIVRAYGYPSLFITFTCNPKWPKILRYVAPLNLKPEDRPDISARVFKVKLDSLINQIRDGTLFGQIIGELYVIEFQKRGLPHAHICLFIHRANRNLTAADVDDVICAEIPNKDEEPELYQLVSEFMMHGPCGPNHLSSPCMTNKKCSKRFPKDFTNETHFDAQGYPLYRRRDNGNLIMISGTELDNRYVVPYNKTLLKQYQAHINVEWCNQLGSIKYLFKYITKGVDRISVGFVGNNDAQPNNNRSKSKDEIAEYYSCRYLSACEVTWRLFEYELVHRTPAVYRLAFHLPDQQPIVFDADSEMESVLSKPSIGASQFLEWMNRNRVDPSA
ncbi:uncharacterized protein [Rutidosis leptorrhynchoides]|uniref:uncharacterized protein n=1 Tax=Rutidosis leptorrhynchoides TaxID=125765 RepID=UPI003A9922F5